MDILKDRLFWFAQPGFALNSYDNYFLWGFVVLSGLGILIRLLSKFVMSHPVRRKLADKFANSLWISGLVGLLWYALRYENTPYFANRYWVAVIILVLVVRWFFILKYLFTGYTMEKASYDRMQQNSKYISAKK